ncbi:glycoside hydrolase family 125 protein [Micromonospora sp. DT47]|uniref:glycoside hydrolase family 125 protein n=1 Tax=Micromonospora sp. DT47 TaxID=3393431 RepID=UPI003CF38871
MTVSAPAPPRTVAAGELRKPLDVGNGLLAASLGSDGCWLSVGMPHPVHGFVELSGTPPFEERWRGDAAAVRSYRSWLTEDRYAFLRLDLPDEAVAARRVGVDDAGRPIAHRTGRGWVCTAAASALPDQPVVVQRYVLQPAPGGSPTVATLWFRGRLDRCALAEITEVNPPAPLQVHTEVRKQRTMLALDAPELPCRAQVSVRVHNALSDAWIPDSDGGATLAVTARAGEVAEIVVSVSLEATSQLASQPRPVPVGRFPHADPDTVLTRIGSGALRYILDCTAMDVGRGERAILTDHRLLPLSWTRDAYYQALLLLTAAGDDHAVTDVVGGHLRWLWGRGRAAGVPWMRSHLPDGRPKDLAVQADQQLYPVLELTDFRRITGGWPSPPGDGGHADAAREWGRLVASVWEGLPRQGPDGLLASAENPADDPSELPFSLSAQILYWHTANQLASWSGELGLDGHQLAKTASDLRAAVHRCFTCPGPYGTQWAYESDGAGRYRLYHDANDLPTAFAPMWQFCSRNDQSWMATMRFAFSAQNPGFVSGRYGGLGSAHTPGTWTLGDAQELAVAWTNGDEGRAAAVLDRLSRVHNVDGLLPETYDPDTGHWIARHWFAWPAAVLGVLHLDRPDR